MRLPGSCIEAMAGEDQAEQNPTIIEPVDTAKEAMICVFFSPDGWTS